ncbi:VQ motif-containing protein 4-like [Canna indica]|uniref:VQ motif-containing protein 4-like n=1 Tax=Canna indica TaxID=4628 RepID=A0AAQ3KQA3_9LILI|nr:VQ motif-containing protein 4-like [Canna indica]
MDKLHQGQEKELQSPNPASPNSSPSSSSSSSNGVATAAPPPATVAPLSTPLTHKSMPRSIDANPYPTTFIQADAGSFKQVVQMLTGSAETASKHAAAPPAKNAIPPAAKATGPKKPAFKLYERRGSMKNPKMISPLIPTFMGSNPNSPMGGAAFSPRRQPEILSPSMLDLPSLTLSPVTPLIPDPFNRSPLPHSAAAMGAPAMSAEDRAIAEKGFYLHPSPRTTPRDAEPPRLLPLFPVTSPRVPSASAAGYST